MDARPAPLRPAARLARGQAPRGARQPARSRRRPRCERGAAPSGRQRRAAREYLGAEFGDRPHHSWTAAACFAALVPLFLFGGLGEVSSAYAQALTAGHAASGTYTWTGVSYLQSPLTFTVDHSQVTQAGGAFTPIVYVLWAVGTIACGRLWRVLPLSSSAKRSPATES